MKEVKQLKKFNLPFEQMVSALSDDLLLRIGKELNCSDFTVRWYKNKHHHGFYKNREGLERAIRRIWAIGAFNHRERIVRILQDHNIVEDNQEVV